MLLAQVKRKGRYSAAASVLFALLSRYDIALCSGVLMIWFDIINYRFYWSPKNIQQVREQCDPKGSSSRAAKGRALYEDEKAEMLFHTHRRDVKDRRRFLHSLSIPALASYANWIVLNKRLTLGRRSWDLEQE